RKIWNSSGRRIQTRSITNSTSTPKTPAPRRLTSTNASKEHPSASTSRSRRAFIVGKLKHSTAPTKNLRKAATISISQSIKPTGNTEDRIQEAEVRKLAADSRGWTQIRISSLSDSRESALIRG